jgi:hypothetical protein
MNRFYAAALALALLSQSLVTPFAQIARASTASPAATLDPNPPAITAGFSEELTSIGSSTAWINNWRKAFDQSVVVQQSANLNALVTKTLGQVDQVVGGATYAKMLKYVYLSVYLVPDDQDGLASQASSSVYSGSLPQQASFDPSNPLSFLAPTSLYLLGLSGGISGTGFGLYNPSAALYTVTPKKYGYLVGVVVQANTSSTTDTENYYFTTALSSVCTYASRVSNSNVCALPFANLPLGSYHVYVATGMATLDSNTTTFAHPYSLFPIQLSPDASTTVNQFMQKMDKNNQSVALSATAANLSVPYFYQDSLSGLYVIPPVLVPLPQSTVRPVIVTQNSVNIVAKEHDTVLGSMSSESVTLKPAIKPVIVVTKPEPGDQWSRSDINHIQWVTNFKRANINDTGVKALNGISLVYPYGRNFSRPIVSPQNSGLDQTSVTLIAQGLDLIPTVGWVLGGTVSILNDFGIFDNSQVFAVNVSAALLPSTTTLAQCQKSPNGAVCSPIYAYHAAGGNAYLENSDLPVPSDMLTKLPSGTYQALLYATWQGGGTYVIGTSSVFTILPFGASPTTSTSTTSTSSQTVSPATTYYCPSGYTGPNSNNMCVPKKQSITTPFSIKAKIKYSCPDGYTLYDQSGVCVLTSAVAATQPADLIASAGASTSSPSLFDQLTRLIKGFFGF